jgi:putative ABC transport system permease protein
MNDDELRDELEFHIAERARLNQAAGMPAREARDAARRQFGNVTRIQEEARRMHAGEFLESILNDARYAWRASIRVPAFTLTALFAIALGVGSSAAVFSVVDRVLFRGLPYPHAERLVSFGMAAPIEPTEFILGADYVEWRASQKPFEAITTWSDLVDCDLTDRNPARLSCARVEASFLPTLGIEPLIGRNFTLDEDRPNGPTAALLSYGLWRSRFGGSPQVIGQSVPLDGRPVTIVGVLPSSFELPTLAHADVLLPQALDLAAQRRPDTGRVMRGYARLKPGVTIEQASAALAPLFQESLKWVPPMFRREVKLRVRSLRDRQVQDARLASWVLLAAVFSVLLIACANVANLMLARAAGRRRELAVRVALGAGRARLIRQTFTESLLLALFGGALGCGLAWVLVKVFVAIAPGGIPRLDQATLDARVLLFALLASMLAGLLFGLAPALSNPHAESLTGRRTVGATRGWFRQSLVAAQIAVSLILLAGAGLLLRSLWNLENAPLGMRADSVLTASITLGRQSYPTPERQQAFFEELERRLSGVPGVTALALSDSLPPSGNTHSMIYSLIDVEGRARAGEGTGGMVVWRSVTPAYFTALGIPITRGRAFEEADRQPDQNPVVLGASLARRLFPNQDAIGQRLRPGRSGPWRTVVGIAADVRNNGLAEPSAPEYYVPRHHTPDGATRSANLIVRSPLDPRGMSDWIRREIAALNPTLPVTVESMQQRVGKLAERPRFNAVLLGLFAAMGLLLAAVGLYGVMAFLVAQRIQEIGVRMALGATRGQIARLTLSQAARSTAAGALAGLLGSFFATRLLRTLLFQAPERDPLSLGIALAVLLTVALAAAFIPARRAAQVDPIEALRQE